MEGAKIYHFLMLAFLLTLVSGAQLKTESYPSHFEFLGLNYLNHQNQLNITSTGVANEINTLLSVSWRLNSTALYTISNMKPTFRYNPNQQTAYVVGNDTVVVQGEGLQVQLIFDWSRSGSDQASGSGVAGGTSIKLAFAYQVVNKDGQFFNYRLIDYERVIWRLPQGLEINHLEPTGTTEDDEYHIGRLLNEVSGVRTVKDTLQIQIDKYFPAILSEVIQAKKRYPKTRFDYSWKNADQYNHTIMLQSRPLFQELDRDGIRAKFEVRPTYSTQWKSITRQVPSSPLDIRVYGSTQEYISYDFYENVLHHACNAGIMTTTLNRKNWGTQTFDFTAGNLGFYIDGIRERFVDNEEVDGECSLISNNLKVTEWTYSSIHLDFSSSCILRIGLADITSFVIDLSLYVDIKVYDSALYFLYVDHKLIKTEYYQEEEFPLRSQQLMDTLIDISLYGLVNTPFFGCGWPLSRKITKPMVENFENYTLIYDLGTISETQQQQEVIEQQ